MSGAIADVDRFARTPDGIEICFRTDGEPGGIPVVLIAGLGQQLISWPAEIVDGLVARGCFVVRPDNRDIGRSSRLDHIRPPDLRRQILRRFVDEQYVLSDMAADTIAVLDALGIAQANVVGMSMGGMIAQTVAARYPDRVLSLVSIFSNTGALTNGWLDPRVIRTVTRPPRREREANADGFVEVMRAIGSPGYPIDEAGIRQLALDAFDRGDGAKAHRGTARQIGAIYKSGDRTAQLKSITAPTLVIHGDRDKMVHRSGGAATAKAIPGARLVTMPGMGHELPGPLRSQFVELIAGQLRRPGSPVAAGG